jgi:predicted AAA+ superfamily ATPase
LSKKISFLFGPRSTGKIFLIHQSFDLDQVLYLNLLHNELFQPLLKYPERLREMVDKQPHCQLIIIDEVQRIPALLNEVHAMI